MGAESFIETAVAATAEEAFAALRERAAWVHGHGGYTGTIAEKHEFRTFALPDTFGSPSEIAKAHMHGRAGQTDAITLAANDKWGPACCFDITETDEGRAFLTRWVADQRRTGAFRHEGNTKLRIGPEPTAKGKRVFVFFGHASS